MYKSGNQDEYFSELFICKLGEKLGFDMAHYEMDGGYIRTKNFTEGTYCHFEPMSALMGANDDYNDCFDMISSISPALVEQYLRILWLDSICYNMDRHTENFGFLRDVQTGKILKMAPNYDNNIALISRGYPRSVKREEDGLIRFFKEFILSNHAARNMVRSMEIPEITEKMICECFAEIPIEADRTFVKEFILNGQKILRKTVAEEAEVNYCENG